MRSARIFAPAEATIAQALVIADEHERPGPLASADDEGGLAQRVAVVLARQGIASVVIDDSTSSAAEVVAAARQLGAPDVAALVGCGCGAQLAVEAGELLPHVTAVAVVVADGDIFDETSVVAEARRRYAPRAAGPHSDGPGVSPVAFAAIPVADQQASWPVAESVATWVAHRLAGAVGRAPAEIARIRPGEVVLAESGYGTFHNHVVSPHHTFVADEPTAFGGTDAGPSPYDLLAAALGACTTMTLRMYADRKAVPVERIVVRVAHDKVHASDAAGDAGSTDPRARTGRIDRFTRSISLEGDLDPAVRTRMASIADRCPVHLTLERSSRIETVLVDQPDGDGR